MTFGIPYVDIGGYDSCCDEGSSRMDNMLTFLFVLAMLGIGSFLQGSIGFGMGLFAMGFLITVMSLKDATLLVLALTIVLSIDIIMTYRKQIEWKTIRLILIWSLLGRVFSFLLIHFYGDSEWIKKWLGIVLIALVIYLYLKPKLQTRMTFVLEKRLVVGSVGLTGGFIGGAFAVGGPIFALYFMHRFEDKYRYMVNMQLTFALTNLVTLAAHGGSGDLSNSFYFYLLFGALFVYAGVKIGLICFRRMPRSVILKLVYLIVIIAGLNMLR